MGAYAGVDWASEAHAACVVDETGRVTVERVVGHDERGVAELCDLLVGEGVQRVALERPDGVLVERLVDAGLVVLAIHPNQVRPPASAIPSPARSPTASTPSSSASWPAPMPIASGPCVPTRTRPRRCGR